MSARACARTFRGGTAERVQLRSGTACGLAVRLQISLRAHALQARLEVGEETAGNVTVDDAMIERQARVHHTPDCQRIVVAHDELLDHGLHGDDSGLTAVDDWR